MANANRIWDTFTEEEKEKLQECLDNIKLERREAESEELNGILDELKEKHNAGHICMYCGKTHKGHHGICRSCKAQLMRCRSINMGEDEIKKFEHATDPENLHWAYVDMETAQRIAGMFQPGKRLSWEQWQPIGEEFAEQKKKIENALGEKEHRQCLICGEINRSRRGICLDCRRYIIAHGCAKPMKEGDYTPKSITTRNASEFATSGPLDDKIFADVAGPLRKVR